MLGYCIANRDKTILFIGHRHAHTSDSEMTKFNLTIYFPCHGHIRKNNG